MADNKRLLAFLSKYHTMMIPTGLPPYEPHHAVPYVFMPAVDELYEDLNADPVPAAIAEACGSLGTTVDSVKDTFRKWMDANTRICGENKDFTVEDGMQRSGYKDCPFVDRLIVEAMFGRAMLAAVWYTLRDITIEGEAPDKWTFYNELGNLLKTSVTGEEPNAEI